MDRVKKGEVVKHQWAIPSNGPPKDPETKIVGSHPRFLRGDMSENGGVSSQLCFIVGR